MTDEEIAMVRARLVAPAGRDHDVRCENGSCHKAASLAEDVPDLLAEVERLREWLRRIARIAGPDGKSWAGPAFAAHALAGDEPPAT